MQKIDLPFSWRAHPPVCSRLWLRANGHFAFGLWEERLAVSNLSEDRDESVNTYTLPWSVVGGARRSGFCSATGMFCGPRRVAPKLSRIGSGSMFDVWFHNWGLGSSLANGTVWEAGGADPTVDAGREVLLEDEWAKLEAEAEAEPTALEDARALDVTALVDAAALEPATVGVANALETAELAEAKTLVALACAEVLAVALPEPEAKDVGAPAAYFAKRIAQRTALLTRSIVP